MLRFMTLVVAGMVVGSAAAPARADVIFSTFGPGNTFGPNSTSIHSPEFYTPDPSYGVLGQGFFTPNRVTTLSQVVVPFRMDSPAGHIAPVAMSIYRPEPQDYDGDGVIDEYYPLLEQTAALTERTVLSGGAAGEPTVFAYSSLDTVELQPNTFYFLLGMVVSDPDTEANNFWFESAFDHEHYLHIFGGYDPAFFDDDKWNAVNIYGWSGPGLAMRVEVTPEPSMLVIFGVIGAGLAAYQRTRRRTSAAA